MVNITNGRVSMRLGRKRFQRVSQHFFIHSERFPGCKTFDFTGTSDDFIDILQNIISTEIDFSLSIPEITKKSDAVGLPKLLEPDLYEELLTAAIKYNIVSLKDYLIELVSKTVT